MASKLVPGIVDTNQDRNHIRLKIDDVALDTGVQINNAVATDPPVQELDAVRSSGGSNQALKVVWITTPKIGEVVPRASSVRDRVTLE